ncbi:hypothetical protein [Novosphingobium guangzhouense]|uniref:hypothetical protein n=1 Tax=Novosphingobium guangzhouense TaxID=1850347 RepID=UPI001FEA5A4F|nr:hypothetical protein [Novosphingobium guangzhouense]
MKNPAYRRYTRRMMPLSLLYVGAIMLASWLVPDRDQANATAIALALLPGLAVLGWIWAMARLLIELDDEYLRVLEVRKFLVATGVTLAVCSVWGLLEIYTDLPRLPVFLVFPLWAMGLFVGMLVNRITQGASGNCA